MDSHGCDLATSRLGDRSTSDVVVRIRTQDGRDEWFYSHSHILIDKSKYFADRLSENWPTCQILDSRSCVEVFCEDSDFDYHVTVLRLLYREINDSSADIWHGVSNALSILQVAIELGCQQIITASVNYLEAVPWEEAEEEEILRITPSMGALAEPILARLQPVNPTAIVQIFNSAIQFATSSPPPLLYDIKSTAQEQLEYMLTEDDEDAPMLTIDDNLKSEVGICVKRLIDGFSVLLDKFLCQYRESEFEKGKIQVFWSYLSDMSWAWQILAKMEILRDFANNWMEASEKIIRVVLQPAPAEMFEVKLKVIEVAAKVLEAMAYGTVILPTVKRVHMVKVWLPFVRTMKPLIDAVPRDSEVASLPKMDEEAWQSLESSFVSIILALPSGEQAEILTEWMGNQHVRYPDLTEAFQVWCYRSKVAKRRVPMLSGASTMTNTSL